MATRDLDDYRTRALGHKVLGRRWNHLILGGDQIPTRLGPPCRLTDRATECLDTPRNLRVSHEGGLLRIHVGRERGGELCLVENRNPSCGGNIGGTGAPGGGSLISDDTDSPLSKAKAVI